MTRALLLLVFCCSCAPTPYRARVRSAEAYILQSCRGYSLTTHGRCLAESKQRCTAAGLEPACGVDGAWDGFGRGWVENR